MRSRRFIQCDVFTSEPTRGNGLAVIVDGDGLSVQQMQRFAAWTQLAETTFLMPPTDPGADYKVRIFTPAREIPFAGHPTLGSCAAWLQSGGQPKNAGTVKQECAVGIVTIDTTGQMPAFAAPPTRTTPMAEETRDKVVATLGIDPGRIVRTAQLDNGPVWQAFELRSAEDVLAVDATRVHHGNLQRIGLFGRHERGGDCDYETRMLSSTSMNNEDPVTGSLNAAIACWMYGDGQWREPVTVAQGTRLDRLGRVYMRRDAANGTIWVGGQTCMLIEGTVTL